MYVLAVAGPVADRIDPHLPAIICGTRRRRRALNGQLLLVTVLHGYPRSAETPASPRIAEGVRVGVPGRHGRGLRDPVLIGIEVAHQGEYRSGAVTGQTPAGRPISD